MKEYHAVMIDETGCEFGVTVRAESKDAAYEQLEEDYPESRVDQLEDDSDREARERRMYDRLEAEADGDYSQWDYEREWN